MFEFNLTAIYVALFVSTLLLIIVVAYTAVVGARMAKSLEDIAASLKRDDKGT